MVLRPWEILPAQAAEYTLFRPACRYLNEARLTHRTSVNGLLNSAKFVLHYSMFHFNERVKAEPTSIKRVELRDVKHSFAIVPPICWQY